MYTSTRWWCCNRCGIQAASEDEIDRHISLCECEEVNVTTNCYFLDDEIEEIDETKEYNSFKYDFLTGKEEKPAGEFWGPQKNTYHIIPPPPAEIGKGEPDPNYEGRVFSDVDEPPLPSQPSPSPRDDSDCSRVSASPLGSRPVSPSPSP
eukprot:CAMPEP_0113708412 /NCGR_PEP_ID=MMETSP0038_2-20120614/28957_1 /TAXON_ID=2898 /ORGANISM="Cryptomonas paramecium" /LENGTH=149 /DNA_ID=CAMNT_0000634095 /DNA_START=218 /DNA_END=663 /DNA_ORIENTATION=+ /assembly_acc=CAM_ASM_000170